MVNITVFGPWSGKKTVTEVDKAGLVTVGAGGLDSYDTEAHLLPGIHGGETGRWNRRGKFCCLAFVADICAFLALLLIIISTGFLLWKVWWVKTEVDKMQPAVMSLSASLTRLQVESDALQSENSALINAYSSQQTGSGDRFSDAVLDDSYTMEDTDADSLSKLANQESLAKQLDGAEASLVGMTIYVAVGKTDSASDTNNLTEELKTLYEESKNAQTADDDDDDDDDDDSSLLYPILDAGDNDIRTTQDPAVIDPVTEKEIITNLRQAFGDEDGDDDDEEDTEEPKRKSKNVGDAGDSDDDEESRATKPATFGEGNLSDSD